ncbi:hypothetical protein [Leifsonia shinshuensis]|uniref:hypothetical protein n=1 Tax=Leifsonia shinshuensis TaxID=150026 RepID=UPI0031E59735
MQPWTAKRVRVSPFAAKRRVRTLVARPSATAKTPKTMRPNWAVCASRVKVTTAAAASATIARTAGTTQYRLEFGSP